MCAAKHYRSFNPKHGRIQHVKEEPDIDLPLVCKQCEKPECLEACAVGAIQNHVGIVVVNAEECIGCGQCVEACPYNAIFLHPADGKAIKCDLCGGDESECVSYCPMKVLQLKEAEL
jgi:Fe-S-cluster-containing hydrogenase component 2